MTNIASGGFWLLLDGRELHLPFKEFPWFRKATIEQILNVEWPSRNHVYWPELEIDLAVESIEHPERYPLVSKAKPAKPAKRRATKRARS